MPLFTPSHSYDTCGAPQVAREGTCLCLPPTTVMTQVAREGKCLCLPPATVMTHMVLHRLLEKEHVFVYP